MRGFIWLAGVACLFACMGMAPARAAVASPDATNAYRPDRILIEPKSGTTPAVLEAFHAQHHSRTLMSFPGHGDVQVLAVAGGETVEQLIAEYQASGLVEFAEPDYWVQAAAVPNDPDFLSGMLWGLENYGQNNGTAHADISATNAWDVQCSASNIVVAVADSGIRATHEDLAANMWVNPRDGGNGFDAFTGTNNPSDGNGHGTIVAGILGAVGNNGKGITGVAWQVQIMDCKCLDSTGTGSISTLLACLEYARTNGARIINASLTFSTISLTMSNELMALRQAGIILVAAAGNGSVGRGDDDINPVYPACFQMDNIVSVAYTTGNDKLGNASNYGPTNVLLAAPGDQIFSTYYTGDSDYYPTNSVDEAGTSFAAPYVSGACALLLAQYPTDSYHDTIARLASGVDKLSTLAGLCRTGGRLNLRKALRTIRVAAVPSATPGTFQLSVAGGLNRQCVIQQSTDLINWSPVFTNTTTTNGTFVYAAAQAATQPQRYFRATGQP
jgi:subtilisin family serine protease